MTTTIKANLNNQTTTEHENSDFEVLKQQMSISKSVQGSFYKKNMSGRHPATRSMFVMEALALAVAIAGQDK